MKLPSLFRVIFQVISLALSLFLIAGCSDKHSSIYIYDNQVYTTNEVSDFDVDHYSRRANTNFLILNDSESMKNKKRNLGIYELCKKYGLNCEKLEIAPSLKSSANKVLDAHKKFAGQKYFVFSPSPELTAKYIAPLILLNPKKGRPDIYGIEKNLAYQVEGMMKDLGIEANSNLREKIMSLKPQ